MTDCGEARTEQVSNATPTTLERVVDLEKQASVEPVEERIPSPDDSDPDPPPDGGLVAWSQVLAGHLTNALTWGYAASFGVYQLYYTDTLQLPPSSISWLGSIQIFLNLFLSVFSGRAADAGYSRHAVLSGSILIVLGSFMTSLCNGVYWRILLAQGICVGIGQGIIFMPSVAIIGSYFGTRKTLALAFSASGSGVGSLIFPSVVQYLTPQIGFESAVRYQAVVALFFAILINLLLRPRLPPRASGPIVEWAAFRELPYALFALGCFLFFWVLYFCFFYINTFASTLGLTPTQAVPLQLIVNATGIPARPLLGWLASHYTGPINTFLVSLSSLAVLFFCWIPIRTVPGLYAWSAVYGVSTGAAQGIFVGALASLTRDPAKLGTRFGMVCTLLAFASLAGPPTAGGLIEVSGGRWVGAQVWAGAVTTLAVACFWAARVRIVGWNVRVKV